VIICYSPADLLGRIRSLSDGQYADLLAAIQEWIADHPTVALARRFLEAAA
jgi:hypothetical protein